ncbi:MAG TPA: ferrochelatase [Nocardioidaceae bacterium]|nr:ferrochelatase [Nocardioidaceae bacterium]
MPRLDPSPYDALLLVSFGGPETPADVRPFLENVTRSRGIPPERLSEVAEHYAAFGGRSPINEQCRMLRDAIRADLAAQGIDLPIYWGNRNWHPYLTDTLRQMTVDGVRRAACFVTSAYASYSGCRQYRENLFDAVASVGPGAPRLDRLRHYFNHPGFVTPFVDATLAALAKLPDEMRKTARLVFVTHSIPLAMNDASGRSDGTEGGAYEAQHRDVASVVAAAVADASGIARDHDLVYCSRSGAPSMPWLEPDIGDHLRALRADGVDAAVVVPIGFVSDHMEVVFDLDTEAAEIADDIGLAMVRAATPGVHPRFVAMVRELLIERATAARAEEHPRATVGGLPPSWNVCPAGCCRNAREPDHPALCGVDAPDMTSTS